MAENFFAACALHDAWTLSDTRCFGAASAETTYDIAIAAATVDIRTFFMCCSLGKPPQSKTNNPGSGSDYFSDDSFRNKTRLRRDISLRLTAPKILEPSRRQLRVPG